jgi:molybdate transport system substrate-binding protein
MSAEESVSGEGWQVRVGVWLERHGRAVLGEGLLALLECIDRCGSITRAAREVGVSYRHAWVTIKQINEAAGEPLVTASAGGSRGGGAALTPCGRLAARLCRGLREQLQPAAAGMLPRLLAAPEEGVVRVAAAVSLEDVLAVLATDHALDQPGARVRVVLGASDDLAEQILAGASVDLFLTADPAQLDRLAAQAAVQADTVTALAENTLAAVGSADLLAAVRRPADLLGTGVARVALAAPGCPLGGYTRAYLEGLGLYEALRERSVLVDHSRAVVAAVQAGQADAGLVYGSAMATAPGCRVLFRVRHPLAPIRYAGAVVSRSRQTTRSRHFLDFLTSAQAARRFRQYGFLPVRRTG